MLGEFISWQSKSQKSASLSSSVAEYVALSEAVKEVMFVIQLLGSIKIVVKYPVMVRVDNVGAIFASSNITTCCTKHVDVRYKYVHDCVEDGVVKKVFVKSTDNDSTRNLSAEHMRSLEILIASKIFEAKRKGVSNDV